jgi:pimeloyl-ACP methyl ester carboxylesterase
MRVAAFGAMALAACSSAPSRRASVEIAARVDTGRVAIEGGSLFYEAAGSGSTVILIHGGNLDRRMWDPQFELLRKRFRVMRYDARGYGRSSAADQPFSAHDDLAALMRGLHIERASIVGLSLGGRIAIDFALKYPEMVDRLVLAAPGISGGSWAPSTDTTWLASATAAAERNDSVGVALAWLGSDYIRSALHPPERAAWLRQISIENSGYWGGVIRHKGELEQAAKPPAADRLETLRVPVLLMVGGNDTPYIHEVAAAITARVSHVRRVDIPSVGHMLNLEATERFNAELLKFLAGK